ncbi:ribosomal RNA small subunit methyltransferase I [Clostridium sp. CAG:1219]|nr:ribosomal RNA small subunit methyltransferase I [Clostridium sp. CAG:1219]
MKKERGNLFVVGTPIGNLGDITYRAVETLNSVDIILAEDTRNTLKLLTHFNIKKSLISYEKHTEQKKISQIVKLLDEGKDIALVSDAGMPIISDPGQNLVSYLRDNDYNVIIIPGVTALITAIVGSGFDSSKFTFEGFLSVSKKQRKKHLEDIKNEKRTMIFYEAPHKILYTLKDLLEALGDRKICICRELTKIYEEYKITTIKQAIEYIDKNGIKGEIVLIVEGKNKETIEEDLQKKILSIPNATLVKEYINSGMDKKDAIKAVAKEKGIPKNEVYKDCLDL